MFLRLPRSELAPSLENRYVGPLDVIGIPSAVNVKLALPAGVHRSTHDVFHVDRLKKYQQASPDRFPTRVQHRRPPPYIIDGVEMYEVEDILAEKKVQGTDHGRHKTVTMYLVKWLGYSSAEATWENAQALRGAPDVLRRYKNRKREEQLEEEEEAKRGGDDAEN